MSALNIGARALTTNLAALQVIGHNIANANTVGYSRQNVQLTTAGAQAFGNGYIGKGVDMATVERSHSAYLTREAQLASSVAAADSERLQRLQQLETLFPTGENGLGATVNKMLNAWADVASSPTNLSARVVALSRGDELAARLSDTASQLDALAYNGRQQAASSVDSVNRLAQDIARINQRIIENQGGVGQPNDLMDQRDALLDQLSQYVQTSTIRADDGSLSVFVAGSQPLVLGNKAATLSIDDPADFGAGSGKKVLNFQQPGSSTKVELNESMLGGGQVAGLLRFQNNDLAEGRNLLGRMAIAISESMNAQNKLGLTLDGKPGENLFAPISLGNATAGSGNTSGATMGLRVADPTQLQASSYEIAFTAAGGSVTRHSDNKVFTFVTIADLEGIMANDGLAITDGGAGTFAGAAANDKFLVNPLAGAAALLKSLQYSPVDLAAANPVNAAMGANNTGTLQMASLRALTNPPGATAPVTITFTGPNSYERSDTGATSYSYTSGVPITFDAATPPTGWSVTLHGAPKAGDTITIDNALNPAYGDWYQRDAGNASALMGLRNVPMFDGATLSDGFASAMAQIGTRTQSALFAAELSSAIATNLERDRTAVSGVNLDEEAARLIQYQQAYQASAKMLQIAQNIFDTLIQGLGR